jgi:hypothetical protein
MPMTRRTFLATPASLLLARATGYAQTFDLRAFERARVLRLANSYLGEAPLTITASLSPRSAGGKHDFFQKAITGGPTLRTRRGRTSSATG